MNKASLGISELNYRLYAQSVQLIIMRTRLIDYLKSIGRSIHDRNYYCHYAELIKYSRVNENYEYDFNNEYPQNSDITVGEMLYIASNLYTGKFNSIYSLEELEEMDESPNAAAYRIVYLLIYYPFLTMANNVKYLRQKKERK